jgi:sodium transport system ATP-binding protein
MVQAESLCKTYPLPRGKRIEAVRGISLHVRAGEIYGLLGPNGAGKTTLLRMLATIIRPTSGRCTVCGISTVERPSDVRRRIGFLSGNTRLYGRLTPTELLAYFGRLYGMDDRAVAARTAELTEVLGMGEFIRQRCEALSTGQTQKVSIARVLLHDPPVLILDEPTLGLDIITSRAILEFIRAARTRGRCILFSTHYMMEAEFLCDRIGFIHRGSILAEGSLDEMYAATGSDNLSDAFLTAVNRAGEGDA